MHSKLLQLIVIQLLLLGFGSAWALSPHHLVSDGGDKDKEARGDNLSSGQPLVAPLIGPTASSPCPGASICDPLRSQPRESTPPATRNQGFPEVDSSLTKIVSEPSNVTPQIRPDVQTARIMRPADFGGAPPATGEGLTGGAMGRTGLLATTVSVGQQRQGLRFDGQSSGTLGLDHDPNSLLSYRSTNSYTETIGMAGLTKLNEFSAPGWVSLRLPASSAPSSPTLFLDTSYSQTYDAYRSTNAVQDMSGILRLQIPIH